MMKYETKIQLMDDCWYRIITGGLVDQAGTKQDAECMGHLQRIALAAEDRARKAERALAEREAERQELWNDYRALQAKQPATLWRKGPPPEGWSVLARYDSGHWSLSTGKGVFDDVHAHIPLDALPGLEQFVPQPVEAERVTQRFRCRRDNVWRHGAVIPAAIEDRWRVETPWSGEVVTVDKIAAAIGKCSHGAPVEWIDHDYPWSQP
jgi:hypothetical protein